MTRFILQLLRECILHIDFLWNIPKLRFCCESVKCIFLRNWKKDIISSASKPSINIYILVDGGSSLLFKQVSLEDGWALYRALICFIVILSNFLYNFLQSWSKTLKMMIEISTGIRKTLCSWWLVFNYKT